MGDWEDSGGSGEDWNCDGIVQGGEGSGAWEKQEVGVDSLADGQEGLEVGMVEERVKSGRGNRDGWDVDRGRGKRKLGTVGRFGEVGQGKLTGKEGEGLARKELGVDGEEELKSVERSSGRGGPWRR